MRKILTFLYWTIVVQMGLDIIRLFRSLKSIPRYIRDLIKFKKNNEYPLLIKPCLFDWYDDAGNYNNEYFWQDLYIAEMIINKNPILHLDIGSRIDGFILSLASSRKVEILDIRNINLNHHNIKHLQRDFINEIDDLKNYADSVSCLHTLEHFGLGRYGDDIDVYAYKKAIINFSLILKKNGYLYLSTPIGKEKILFNANRVFEPQRLIKEFTDCNFSLIKSFYISKSNKFLLKEFNTKEDIKTDSLGIFILKKN